MYRIEFVNSFLNQPAQDFQATFTWPASDAVVQDNKPIQLERVAVHDGYLEIELSEEPDLATTTAILVDGATATWTVGEDHYTLKSATILAQGSHTFSIGTTLADLNGGALAQAFTTSFSMGDKDNKSLFEAVDPRETQASTIGNVFGFQGLPVDPETGLVYFRNRYYDPGLGRFMTVDSMGYADGPSMYTFERADPENGGDPYGLLDKETEDSMYVSPGPITRAYSTYVEVASDSKYSASQRIAAGALATLVAPFAGGEEVVRGLLNTSHAVVSSSREGGEHFANAVNANNSVDRAKEIS